MLNQEPKVERGILVGDAWEARAAFSAARATNSSIKTLGSRLIKGLGKVFTAVFGLLVLSGSLAFGQSVSPLTESANKVNSGFGENQNFLSKRGEINGDFTGAVSPEETKGTGTKSPPEGGTLNTSSAEGAPNVVLVNSVASEGATVPGADLVYTIAFTNDGGRAAHGLVLVDPIPAETDFKLGSQNTVLGATGMTVAIEYSSDAAVTWTYTPVSGGGGATADYDRLVTHVRWTFTGGLSNSSPNNTGSVGLTAKIR